RIACRYLTPGCVINLGTGIPNDVIGAIIHEEQLCAAISSCRRAKCALPLDLRKLIGRIACRYLTPGCVINLGTGIPND
ncbi:hypothetical protein C7D74_32725, partial [Klebsiella pneumoniae]